MAAPSGADPPLPLRKRGKYASKTDKEQEDPISCVNIKLNSLWNPSFIALGSTFDALVLVFDRVVLNWNKIAQESSWFANLHMLRLLREGKPLPNIDQKLFEACCRAVTEGSKERKEEEIRVSIALFQELRPSEGVDYKAPVNKHSTHLINNLRRQFETNAKNHVVCNFVPRLIRYVMSRYSLSRKDAWIMVKATFDPKNAELSLDQESLKSWLVYDPLNDRTLKSKVDHFFRLTYDMLQHQENLDPMTKGRKTFSLLPVASSYIMAHAILDRSTLQEVLQQLHAEHRRVIGQQLTKGGDLVRDALARKEFNFSSKMFSDPELSAEIWRLIFCVEPMETRNRHFDYGLSTNGYDVSLRFRVKNKPAWVEREYSPEMFDRFVGVDPGRTFIATGYATTSSDAEEFTQISLKEYRHLSKMNESREWERRLRVREAQYKSIIEGMPTMKTTNVDESIRYHLRVADWMFRFCRKKPFLKWRFKTKIYSRKTMAEVARRVTGGKKGGRTVVGLGDWSQQDGFLKGTPKAPIKRMKDELKKRATVLDIDEYRTSKTCSACCGQESMKNVRVYRDANEEGATSRRLVKCHQIVRCLNIDCSKCWQRDRNAARNIYGLLWGLLSGEERPPAMTRKKKDEMNSRAITSQE
jgi:hypothetical protein